MQMPSVVHPKQIRINDFTFEVVSYCKLTDEQASNAAIFFYRTHKLKKKHQRKVIQVISLVDADSARLFGE